MASRSGSVLKFLEKKDVLVAGYWRETLPSTTYPVDIINICIDYSNEVTQWTVSGDGLIKFHEAEVNEIILGPTFTIKENYEFQMELTPQDSYGNKGNHTIIACRLNADLVPIEVKNVQVYYGRH